MKGATRERMLKEIVELVQSHSSVADDEVTTEEVASEMGVSVEDAYHALRREVAQGTMTKRKITLGGHVCCAWRKVATSAESGTIK